MAVNSGALGSDVTNPDSMYFNLSYIPEGGTGTPVKAGDKIEFRLQKGSEMVSHEVTVAGEQTPNRPTSMKLESSTVARGDAVFATLIFDDAYVPDPDDRVLVQPYDEDDNALEATSSICRMSTTLREGPAQGQRQSRLLHHRLRAW